jgi:hypothetical protein
MRVLRFYVYTIYIQEVGVVKAKYCGRGSEPLSLAPSDGLGLFVWNDFLSAACGASSAILMDALVADAFGTSVSRVCRHASSDDTDVKERSVQRFAMM